MGWGVGPRPCLAKREPGMAGRMRDTGMCLAGLLVFDNAWPGGPPAALCRVDPVPHNVVDAFRDLG